MNRRSLLLLPLLAACAPAVELEQTVTAVAVVETIDQQSREVLLRGQAGAQTGTLLPWSPGAPSSG